MFELAAGTLDRPFRDKHVGPAIFSIVTHVVVVGTVVGATLFLVTGGLPEVPPMMAFVAELPAPSPPPPPPPPASGPKATRPPQPVSTAGQLAVPIEVPTGITAESGINLGEEEGVPGGVEGGIPGGIVGGIVGGIISDVPPPPPPPLPPPPPPPQRLSPVRIGGQLQAPALIHRVEPIYPDFAVAAHVTGVVILEATVNERGEVTNVVVLRSRPMLDRAAIEAVKQWRYAPLLLNGRPAPFVLTVTMTFSIQ